MSHPNQMAFVEKCSSILKNVYPHPRVAEMGSYAVYGTVRPIFNYAREYVGIDLTPGPSVDVVASAHEFGESNAYDLVLACEVFEHNPFWLESFVNMIRICRPGGTVLFTCASRGRPEHGTARTLALESPGTSSEGWSYYRNLTERDFQGHLNLEQHFTDHIFFRAWSSFDLYFIGIKRPVQKHDDAIVCNWIGENRKMLRAEVAGFRHSHVTNTESAYGRVHNVVLRAAARIVPEKPYQSLCYWGPQIKGIVTSRLRSALRATYKR
jgi:SAM-dependent methyltransferase